MSVRTGREEGGSRIMEGARPPGAFGTRNRFRRGVRTAAEDRLVHFGTASDACTAGNCLQSA